MGFSSDVLLINRKIHLHIYENLILDAKGEQQPLIHHPILCVYIFSFAQINDTFVYIITTIIIKYATHLSIIPTYSFR